MSESISRIPRGFRYYSAKEARACRFVEAIAMESFSGWSYEEIVTPTLDYYSLFAQGMGQVEAKRSFRFSDADGSLLTLRPDVTSSIARAAATLFAKHPRPLRLCYSAKVFRQHSRSSADWRRESSQLGCELLGQNSTAADVEVLSVAMEVLKRLELNRRFVVTLSDAEIFSGIVENLDLDVDAREELRRLMDIRAVADLERFLASYASATEASAFADLVRLPGKSEILTKARQVITNSRSRSALDRLENLWRVIELLGWSANFEVDLGDVSRLGYYTALTFKIYVEGLGRRVGGGGRYDNLTANFGTAEPAIGFVLEMDALAELLSGRMQAEPSPVERVVGSSEIDVVSALFREVIQQRTANQRVMIKSRLPDG